LRVTSNGRIETASAETTLNPPSSLGAVSIGF
jgi:hypothetical protein